MLIVPNRYLLGFYLKLQTKFISFCHMYKGNCTNLCLVLELHFNKLI